MTQSGGKGMKKPSSRGRYKYEAVFSVREGGKSGVTATTRNDGRRGVGRGARLIRVNGWHFTKSQTLKFE